jgi:hypothetical protein
MVYLSVKLMYLWRNSEKCSLVSHKAGSCSSFFTGYLATRVITPPTGLIMYIGIMMIKKILVAAACAMITISAQAVDSSKVEKSIELKNGATVYIFKDGKMAMEDKAGRVVPMKAGQVMEAKDGSKIIMVGNELSRLESILHSDHKN